MRCAWMRRRATQSLRSRSQAQRNGGSGLNAGVTGTLLARSTATEDKRHRAEAATRRDSADDLGDEELLAESAAARQSRKRKNTVAADKRDAQPTDGGSAAQRRQGRGRRGPIGQARAHGGGGVT